MILPGKQHLSLIATLVLGVASAVVGGLICDAVFRSNDGVAWIGSIIVAVIALFFYGCVVFGRVRHVRTRRIWQRPRGEVPPTTLEPR